MENQASNTNQQQTTNQTYRKTYVKPLVAASVASSLALSSGLIFSKLTSSAGALIPSLGTLGSVFTIGGAVGLGLCVLLPISISLIKLIRRNRAAAKLRREQKIALRKSFFEKMGYDLPSRPTWKSRFSNWITSRFKKSKRQQYKAKKQRYLNKMADFKSGKKLLEKTPWTFVNITSSVLKPNGSDKTQSLSMMNLHPVTITDPKTKKQTLCYQVASVYPDKSGQTIRYIPCEKLDKIDPKTKLANFRIVEGSDEEIMKMVQDDLIDSQINISANKKTSHSPRRKTNKSTPKIISENKSPAPAASTGKLNLAKQHISKTPAAPDKEELSKSLTLLLQKILPEIVKSINQHPEQIQQILTSQSNNIDLIKLATELIKLAPPAITQQIVEQLQEQIKSTPKIVPNSSEQKPKKSKKI